MKFTAAILAAMVASGQALFVPSADAKVGDVVPRSYVLTAEGVSCADLTNSIDFLKGQIEGVAQRMAEAPARAYPISSKCFLSFVGGETLKNQVAAMAGVVTVEANRVVATNAPASWGLDRIDQDSLPLDGADWNYPSRGAGVTVYIVDTGINANHVDFGGRASYGYDAVNEGSQTDGNGHGTHCSGTAAGATYGIARSADIVGVKVLSSSGSGTYEGVIAGIEWSASDANGKGVMSLSLGGPNSATVDNAVKAASDAGMIVVVAAGNDSGNACNHSPAAAGGNGANGGVITVGSTTSSDDLSSFSNYGSCVDILAPGSSITSAWIGSTTATNTISGTSMATPHVAGVAAVCLGIHGTKAGATDCIFDGAINGAISNPRGSPNLLLRMPTDSSPTPPTPTPPTPTPPTPTPPTPTPPTPTPPTPTPPTPTPPAVWTCPRWWYNANDGCDCECGLPDPDCDRPDNRYLYCNGRFADPNEICNENLECVVISGLTAQDISATGRQENGPSKLDAPETNVEAPASPSMAVPIAVGAGVGCAVLIVGAVVGRRMSRNSAAATTDKPVVASPEIDL